MSVFDCDVCQGRIGNAACPECRGSGIAPLTSQKQHLCQSAIACAVADEWASHESRSLHDEIAKELGVCEKTVWSIVNGHSWPAPEPPPRQGQPGSTRTG